MARAEELRMGIGRRRKACIMNGRSAPCQPTPIPLSLPFGLEEMAHSPTLQATPLRSWEWSVPLQGH